MAPLGSVLAIEGLASVALRLAAKLWRASGSGFSGPASKYGTDGLSENRKRWGLEGVEFHIPNCCLAASLQRQIYIT